MSNERTLRIALVGAPGSGKTDLARALAKELGDTWIIDGYVNALVEETDLALSHAADLIPNLMCATERYKQELKAENGKLGTHYITCGTLIESNCYAAVRGNLDFHGLNDFDARIHHMRVEAAVNTLSMFMGETWVYTHVFYLPLPQNHEDEWDKRLDWSIREALAMLQMDHIPLTDEDQVMQALEALKEPSEDPEPETSPSDE